MNKIFFVSCVAFQLLSCTRYTKILYKEDQADFVNPERGFYIPIDTRASNFIPLDSLRLRSFREIPQKPGKATYKVQVSLIYRGYVLDSFRDEPISNEFLEYLQKDFNTVRAAGLKMILRFAYTNTAVTGNCKSEYKICPPYGDAQPKVVFNHIKQLKPLLQKNSDVIAVMQEGFIGIWGENYFTDYFGDASTNGMGVIADSSWLLRNKLLNLLLNALPKDRMIQVRTPQIKQKFVYGPSASVNSSPLTIADAFSEEGKARIGFHNDCFLSGIDDYGTYYDYGSSSQLRRPANEILREYISADTKFTVVGGETCDDTYSPQNDCEPAGHAETEMKNMHYSFLNATYNTDVDNDWDSGGCMTNIKKKLGYRLSVTDAKFPKKIKRGSQFKISIDIENYGYASPFNPRPVFLVLRNTETLQEQLIPLKMDVQFLFTGLHKIDEAVKLDTNLAAGKYGLFLFLPDADMALRKRPEYSVRLANAETWESKTGYNNLDYAVIVK